MRISSESFSPVKQAQGTLASGQADDLTDLVYVTDHRGHGSLAKLSPYQTEHINRFGNYSLNPNRTPEPLEQHLGITPA